jgi:hypothetical protein
MDDGPRYIESHRALMSGWNDFYRGRAPVRSRERVTCPDWTRMRPADEMRFNPRFPRIRVPAPRIRPRYMTRAWMCGLLFRQSRLRIASLYVVPLGLFSYFAGPRKFVVERLLLDPLLTRLPPTYRGRYLYGTGPFLRPGHVFHDVPAGYFASLAHGDNRIADPVIARLYDDVRLATMAPLLAPGRAAAIWRLNTGHDYGTDVAWAAARAR